MEEVARYRDAQPSPHDDAQIDARRYLLHGHLTTVSWTSLSADTPSMMTDQDLRSVI
jgi:hypothetical protein